MTAGNVLPAADIGALVHRGAGTEVFLVDARPTGEHEFTATARLPHRHAYYNDLPDNPRGADPLLLLEACRQAGSYLAHTAFELPLSTAFLVTDWEVRTRPAAQRLFEDGDGALTLHITAENQVQRAGTVRSVRWRIALSAGRAELGEVVIGVVYAGATEYRALRTLQYGGPPPRSDALPDRPAGSPATPAEVGRARAENVLVAGLSTTAPVREARLAVPLRHPTLFVHPNDHFTALILTDAARQLCFARHARATGAPAAGLALTGFTGTFSRFAELDAPVLLSIPEAPGGAATAPAGTAGVEDTAAAEDTVPAEGTMPVEVRQHDRTIADLGITYAPVTAARRNA
ncbi:AfsA-related hotdog domain-containing protein [Kitasatospora sp. NPDC058032]|uniref:AfsA-related hotdog domain-containing protein n=1 Tax=Kitasatospora sp. NPDC058032 TaxID=3346307 RepID=UPI0036DF4FB8